MEEVIGLRGTPGHGSLKEWGVSYRELPLAKQGLIDWTALRTAITSSESSLSHLESPFNHLHLLSAKKQLSLCCRMHCHHPESLLSHCYSLRVIKGLLDWTALCTIATPHESCLVTG